MQWLRVCQLGCVLLVSATPTERTIEDHEKVYDALSHWPRNHNNSVTFKNNPEKYYLLLRPQVGWEGGRGGGGGRGRGGNR